MRPAGPDTLDLTFTAVPPHRAAGRVCICVHVHVLYHVDATKDGGRPRDAAVIGKRGVRKIIAVVPGTT